MSCQYCFLCATDEGVFLEITTGNKQIFHEQFETCSITKVPSTDQLPTKICHKCAYELNQCASFVKKYKSSVKPKSYRNPYCNLCSEVTKKEFIFDLSRDRNLQQKLLEIIQTIFKNDVRKQDCKYVCLACRYTVDLLLDLKNVSQKIATKLNDVITAGIDYSKFSKIKTSVLSRKTTTTESARQTINISQDSDHKLNETMRTRGQYNKLNNNQLSEDQSKSVICNKCRSIIPDDTHQTLKRGRVECKSCSMKTNVKLDEEKQQNITETKSCKVFLKDILKDASLKERNLKVEESKKTYSVKKKDSPEEGNAYKASSDVEDDAKSRSQKRLRSLRSENNGSKKAKLREDAIVEQTEDTRRQTRQRKNNATAKQNSDSDPVVVAGRTTRQKRGRDTSLSDADVNDVKHNNKRLKSILAGNTALRNYDASSKSLITIDLTQSDLSDSQEEDKTMSTRSQRTSQKVLKSKSSQKSQISESNVKSFVDKDELFTCKECQVSSENKLESLIHLLTHYKRPKLELERVATDSAVKESNASEATDDECEDQTETVAIRVDDDEEEATDDVNNLNINEHAPTNPKKEDNVSSEDPSKVSSKSEESTVDGELAIKESNVDRSDLVSKETEETQKDESTEAASTKSPVRQRKRSTSYFFRRSKSESAGNKSDKTVCKTADDCHSDLDEDKDTSRTQVEDEVSKEEKENEDAIPEENGEKELRVEEGEKEESRVEEKDKKELRMQEEEKEESRIEEEEKAESRIEEGEKVESRIEKEDEEKEVRKDEENKDKENEDEDEDEELKLVKKDKEEEVRVAEGNEKDELKVDEETIKKEARVEEKNEEENKKEEVRVEGEDREEEVTEIGDKEENSIESSTVGQEVVELNQEKVEEKDKNEEKETACAMEDSEVMDKENASESKDSGEKIVDENTIDISKVDKQHETKQSTKRISSINGQIEDTEEITLIDDTGSIESNDDKEHKNSVTIEDTLIKSSTMSMEASLSNEIDVMDESNVEITDADNSESNTSKRKKSTSDSANVAAEVLQEVFDLASAEVQNRQEVENSNCESASIEAETLENISREIQNTADMPALKLDSPGVENGNGTGITL